MNEYYAVQRSEEYLEHYGVKGMKWHVRKAIARGNERKLSRQYNKAAKKLAKLQAKASASKLNERAAKLDKVSKGARKAGRIGLGATGLGLGTAAHVYYNMMPKEMARYNKARNNINRRLTEYDNNVAKGHAVAGHRHHFTDEHLQNEKLNTDRMNAAGRAIDIGRIVKTAGVATAAAGYGTAAAAKLRARSLRKKAGDAAYLKKAQSKANAFKSEMNKAFAGTKYAGKTSVARQGKKRKR